MRIKTLTALLLALLALPGWAKTVLLIESYHSEYPWDQSYIEGLKETLNKDVTIEGFQMDTKRLPKDQYQAQADKAWQRFQETKPDLVILGDDNALKFLAKKIDATGTPTVFLGINSNPRAVGVDKMPNVTGILERPLFKRNISEIKEIMGDKLKNMLVLFDSGNTSKASVVEAFRGKTTMNISGVNTHLEMIGDLDKWHSMIKNADKKYDAIVVGLYHTITDKSGKHIPAGDILSWTSKNSPIPLFAFWDFTVGEGKTIGGMVLFGKIQGQEAAKVANRILAGEKPEDIRPTIAKKGRFYFSKSELDRWGLKLPANIAKRATLTH